MKITIIGGTGLIGGRLVPRLRQGGHKVRAASRSLGINAVTGEGLDQAIEGADVVVDVSNSGYFEASDMQRFVEASGANLIAAERKAGIVHHVILSAVGTRRLGSGYFRAKAAQEEIVLQSDIPFTIVRSTPFFEFIHNIVDAGRKGDEIRLPPVLVQPIAAEDVAGALSRVVLRTPANATMEIGGPGTYRLPALAEEMLTAGRSPRRVVSDLDAPYFGTRIGDDGLVVRENPRFAPTSFPDWLGQASFTARRRATSDHPRVPIDPAAYGGIPWGDIQ